MTVIRPDREGGTQAQASLNATKRSRGEDKANELVEGKRADATRVAREDGTSDAEREKGEAGRLTSLLHRAGIGSSNTSGTSTATTRLGNTGSSRAITSDAVVKVQAKIDELQLGPVTAPRTDLNARLSESALSFAQNVDRVFTGHLTQVSSALNAQGGQLDRGDNPRLQLAHGSANDGTEIQAQRVLGTIEQQRAVANENVLARLLPTHDLAHTDTADERGLQRVIDDTTADTETELANADAHGALADPTAHGTVTVPTTHGTGTANANTSGARPKTNSVITQNRQEAALASALRVDRGSGPIANAMETSKRLTLLDMSNLSADQLLAEFLKLNINDPNMNVETQNKLYTLASEMRQLAIEEAKKRIERAQELMKEAQAYADKAEKYADMAGMIGIAAAFLGPLGAILSGIMQIVVAVMQYEAQMMMLDAKEEKNNAERFKLMGDMHQNQVQETAEFINTIMELKNQMIESVIQMLNASFSTRQQLMSAAMAR